ncbi:hypothetical protein MBEHAL_1784 [Halarchaeum acidiphilum MH1-52-1]|uniref:Uncharacterized protein n=1 Tax=Halarchaeum acidiphilum MH1-52-1 TaxID=1261545 RepID=U3A5T9_9EURY|nr:hypothetical protein MBEHAL_1784 [Halarchaeum acidiphilum MH1-52-1]
METEPKSSYSENPARLPVWPFRRWRDETEHREFVPDQTSMGLIGVVYCGTNP